MSAEPVGVFPRCKVWLTPGEVVLLRQWKATQKRERLAAGPAWETEGHVWTRRDGKGYNPDWISTRFKQLVSDPVVREQLKVRGKVPSLHSLRHTTATIAREKGLSESGLTQRLGHSSPAVTQQLYGRYPDEAAQAWTADLDRALEG